MVFANNVPDVPKKKQRRTFLIVKKGDGSYCTLRNDSDEFVYRSHKDVEKRLKHAVPFFVALKDEDDRPSIAEVVGKASNSSTAADVLDSFNEQLKNTNNDSGLFESKNWEFCVSGILFSIMAIACFVAVKRFVDSSNFPDEYLGVWKMSNTSDLKSYFDNNSAKRYIPHDIPKFLESKALPIIIFEKAMLLDKSL